MRALQNKVMEVKNRARIADLQTVVLRPLPRGFGSDRQAGEIADAFVISANKLCCMSASIAEMLSNQQYLEISGGHHIFTKSPWGSLILVSQD